ncbi:MAG: 4-alpha-glucanotransferase, partial [Duncaniella sp.]|nr:4-alpha-glucanotransferase [Duncaniella sp.]
MKITFHVNYHTQWGESLYVTGEPKALGGGDPSKAVAMSLTGSQTWSVTVELPDSIDVVTYGYMVRRDNGTTRREWGKPRHLERHTSTPYIYVIDRWQDQPWDKPYYAAAFTDCICQRKDRAAQVEAETGCLTLSVDAPMVAPDEVVAVSGESGSLGKWDTAKAVRMSDADYPTWKVNLPLADLSDGMQYKFLIVKKATGDVVAWEGRDNRELHLPADLPAKSAAVDAGQRLVNPLAPWRGAGVAIPVFSLRSEEDFGVGDFMDLKKMIDWAVATRQNFV